MQSVKVDIWSDIACPWCYVGKRRLEAGIAAAQQTHPNLEVEIEYHSFELSPGTPVDFDGTEVDFLVGHKGMPEGQVRDMLRQMTTLAAEHGLAYDFDALQVTGTLLAHELLHFAKAHGLQLEMKERLLAAHFVEGRHVGQIDALVELASEVGLDTDAARQALESHAHAADVQADLAQATDLGISGVPFHVIDGRYGVSGAQPAEAFAEVLDRVLAERQEATA